MAYNLNRQHTDPVRTPRSKRTHPVATATSGKAGFMIPIAATYMRREDAARGYVEIGVGMDETYDIFYNTVGLRLTAWVWPLLAAERFQKSRDQFDRSYMGQKQTDNVGATVVPFVETHAMGTHGANAVYKALGLHGAVTEQVATWYLEAYNAIANFRYRNRSKDLTLRGRLETTLARALWNDSRFEHVLPDFDQARIDGEVALRVVEGKMPIRGFGLAGTLQTAGVAAIRDTDGNITSQTGHFVEGYGSALNTGEAFLHVQSVGGYPDIYAELAANGVKVSLADLATARKAQWFAKLREKYDGLAGGDASEYLIDLLMQGINVADLDMTIPHQLADVTTQFAQAKRHAQDSGNLQESATSGGARVGFDIAVPQLNEGGVIMIMAEIMPRQLWERQADPFFNNRGGANEQGLPIDWPRADKDEMDPEKVDVILNRDIDVLHTDPDGAFGYGPLHILEAIHGPRAGGKLYRPASGVGGTAERQRIWPVETIDPVLGPDFYVVPTLTQEVFLDTTGDVFEFRADGRIDITGLTVFGGLLVEATNNYDKVLEDVEMDRIEKEA